MYGWSPSLVFNSADLGIHSLQHLCTIFGCVYYMSPCKVRFPFVTWVIPQLVFAPIATSQFPCFHTPSGSCSLVFLACGSFGCVAGPGSCSLYRDPTGGPKIMVSAEDISLAGVSILHHLLHCLLNQPALCFIRYLAGPSCSCEESGPCSLSGSSASCTSPSSIFSCSFEGWMTYSSSCSSSFM